jgi:hypothetical protein
MKTRYLTLVLLSKIAFCQNLIQNGSFENFSSSIMEGPGQGELSTFWNINTPGSPDYFNPGCLNVDYHVPNNIAGQLLAFEGSSYVGIATYSSSNSNVGEYIATTVNLLAGATYEFKMKISLASTCGFKSNIGLNIVQSFNTNLTSYFDFITGPSNNEVDWGVRSTANGTWEELNTTFVANSSGSLTLIVGYFRDGSNNVASSNGNTGNLTLDDLAYYLIDDVSLIEILPPPLPPVPCCPHSACYTNTSSLPSLTLVTDFIKAGNAQGCFASSTGPVTISSGQNVVFRAGSFIEIGNQEISPGSYTNIAGMDIQQGAIFDAFIDGCNSSNFTSVPPINIVSVPNLFIRSGQNPFYIVKVENALTFSIEVKNRWGTTVFEATGTIGSNQAILWTGNCNQGDCSDGEYFIFLTFSNCNSSITLEPFPVAVGSAGNRTSNQTDSVNLNNGTLDNLSEIEQDINESEKEIAIYPNPTMDKLFFTNLMDETYTVNIIDGIGERVLNQSLNSNGNGIDCSQLANGIYFVLLSNAQKKLHFKFVKN